MNLGKSIQSARKKLKISQGELADASGITQAYLSQIENNKKEPNLSTLKKISETLNIPLPILFFSSLSSEDIPDDKKEAFSLINNSLNNLITSIFTTDK